MMMMMMKILMMMIMLIMTMMAVYTCIQIWATYVYFFLHGIDIPTRSLCAEVVAAGKSGFPELPSVSAMLDDSTHTLSGISQQAQKLQQQMLEVQQEKWPMFSGFFSKYLTNRSFSKKKGTFEFLMIFLFPRWGCLFSSLADIPPFFLGGGGGGVGVMFCVLGGTVESQRLAKLEAEDLTSWKFDRRMLLAWRSRRQSLIASCRNRKRKTASWWRRMLRLHKTSCVLTALVNLKLEV